MNEQQKKKPLMRTKTRYIKSIAAAVAFGVVLYGLFLMGTYDPYQELSMLAPDRVAATGWHHSQPTPPTCPYTAKDGRVIVDFGDDRLLSNQGDARAYSDIVAADVPAGTYTVKLASWDGYNGRETVTQPIEQWHGVLFNGTTEVAVTESISDVPDEVREAMVKEEVASDFVLSSAVDGVQAKHAYIGTGQTPNSVVPICAVFDRKEEPKACELTLTKEVDKTTAVVGDELTYTIVIKNTGTADCTGGGVRIVDVVDPQLAYINFDISDNLSAGYGSAPVYSTSDHTLRFNGHTLRPGESGTITWTASVVALQQCGDFTVKNKAKATAKELNNFKTWSYSDTVETAIEHDCVVPPACESFTATPSAITKGESAALAWDTTNATRVVIDNGVGDVAEDGSTSVAPVADTVYTLTAFGTGSTSVTCEAPVTVTVPEEPVLSCDSFTATPSTIMRGEETTLAWTTSYAYRVVINNSIGDVPADGSVAVSLQDSITYVLSVLNDNQDVVDTCELLVTVEEPENTVPQCVSFTGTPTTVPFAGGTTTLAWQTINADTVTVSGIGAVAKNDTRDVFVATDTTFVLTVADADGEQDVCEVPIVLEEAPVPISCAEDVTFTISDNTVDEGDTITLNWSVSDRLDNVAINQGIGSVANTGSRSQSVDVDTTFTLTASAGDDSVQCPVSVDVDTGGGGGGGGSPSPRCELEISDTRIEAGEEVIISWDTTRATEVELRDDRDNIIFTTDDFINSEKKDWYDGSITVNPTRDTTYTLQASRGSRDRECEVAVEIDEEEVVVITERQTPLVAGISLSEVPYTGFEAGPILTTLFYMLLMVWALYIAYIVVIKRDLFAEAASTGMQTDRQATPVIPGLQTVHYPQVSVQAVKPPKPLSEPTYSAATIAASQAASDTVPANLPTGTEAVAIGYENYSAPETSELDIVTAIENQAHKNDTLLSSDAIKCLIGMTTEANRSEVLDCVIAAAKVKYPTEDGWMVLNQTRMDSLCSDCLAGQAAAAESVSVPTGTGSLAEAIVTGNIMGAYGLIGNRPMLSVADAVADLDALYRTRQGEQTSVSELLVDASRALSDTQIHDAITALTTALDGTYSTEEEAVKMAIMKATKVIG